MSRSKYSGKESLWKEIGTSIVAKAMGGPSVKASGKMRDDWYKKNNPEGHARREKARSRRKKK